MIKLLKLVKAYIAVAGHLLKLFSQLLYAIWRIYRLTNAPVTVFGGTHLEPKSIYMKQASELAGMLATHGIPVLTGGGPGIMEAASCGALAKERDKKIISTMGINVEGLDDDSKPNKCGKNNLKMSNFASRKWLLINYSIGFAVFPGGFGTLNELTELLTLIQTNKRKKAPIVLIGKSYWDPFIDWIFNSALAQGLIKQEDAELFTLTDNITQAFELLYKHCQKASCSIFDT